MLRTLRNRKGFTLVELAIVLVIIGILLGAVLKGQEMIKSAKYKRLYNTYREMIAATYTYYDKYQKYPGDDNGATVRWPTAVTANGNANGYVDAGGAIWCGAGGGGENCVSLQHLRLGNLLTGAASGGNSRIAPSHPFGGRIGLVRLDAGAMGMPNGPWSKPFGVCFEWLNNETARWLDTTYDDGVWNTGSIRGNADFTAGSQDAVVAEFVCIEG